MGQSVPQVSTNQPPVRVEVLAPLGTTKLHGTRVAFLKGINVGGHRLTMDELRSALAPLGLPDVRTFIASGNVIFGPDDRTSDALETEIEGQLSTSLGYGVATFLRSLPALSAVADFVASQMDDSGWKPHVMFGKTEASAEARKALAGLETPDDLFRHHGREVVWLRRGGLTDSDVKSHHLNRALQKQPVTTRTVKTVQRLVAKLGA